MCLCGLDRFQAVMGRRHIVAHSLRSLAIDGPYRRCHRRQRCGWSCLKAAVGPFVSGVAAGRVAAGRRTTDSLPLPGPSLLAVIVPPASHQSFHERKSNAKAAFGSSRGAVSLGEQLEHLGKFFGCDTDPGVLDPDDDASPS